MNLIFKVICSEREMHELAVSFFMHDWDKRLPGLDEVLICQPDTPLEQVQSSSHPWSRYSQVLTPGAGTVKFPPVEQVQPSSHPWSRYSQVLTPGAGTVKFPPLEQVQSSFHP